MKQISVNRADTRLLTGIPRAGTTLAVHILAEVDNVVALHEPLSPALFNHCVDRIDAAALIETELEKMRQEILDSGEALSKQVTGEIPSNPVAALTATGLRKEIVSLDKIRLGKPPQSGAFKLVAKHNALFTALIDLLQGYETFALVRNPLAVLVSWSSVNFPVNRGRAPMAERYDKALRDALDATQDVLERQGILLTWFFARFRRLPDGHVIRYEELISSNGAVLSAVCGNEVRLSYGLEEQAGGGSLPADELVRYRDFLLERPHLYEGFYTVADIEMCFHRLQSCVP